MTQLATTMQAFFTDRLINQKNASPRTIAAYRDTMRLLLTFASETTGTPPSRLDIEQLDASLIGGFLEHLERDRGNSPRTRNARGWRRSTRSTATPRCVTPTTRTRSRA
jgi:site-specific recombinase XerC